MQRRGGGRALLSRPGDQRAPEPIEMADGWPAQRLKAVLDIEVGHVEQQDAVRRMPVTPGASDLLHVLF